MKKAFLTSILGLSLGLMAATPLKAAEYKIDIPGMHAGITFRIQHLGYSWLYGRFNDFDGTFTYDEAKPEAASIEVTIKTTSVDSNHAERDRHLRGSDFLNVSEFPEAKFVSTNYQPNGDGTGVLTGDFTLRGVTKPLSIEVEEIGAGKDPWGGERRGFEGKAEFALADYGIDYNLGPASRTVQLMLSVEGIKQ